MRYSTLKTCLVKRDPNASNLKKDKIKKTIKVITIVLLYILSILYPQTCLSVSILYILRVEDNYSLCFFARTGERFSSGAGLGTSRTNSTASELYAYSTQRANEGSRTMALQIAA